MRSIEIRLCEQFHDVLQDLGVTSQELSNAVGYLSMWAIGGRLAHVRIFGDRHGELTANYQDDQGNVGYVIGAVPREDGSYSFHS
jgi:hypothetical protein